MSEIEAVPIQEASSEKNVPNRPPPKPSAAIPSLDTLRTWLPIYFLKSDRTILQLNEIFSSSAGTDTLLMTICYTSLLSSTILSSLTVARARNLIEKAMSLPPSSASPSSRLLLTSKRLKSLSELISDYRIFTRSWDLLSMYQWGRGVLLNPAEDIFVRRIVYAQVLVNVLFQYLENMAYLSSKGILGWDAKKQNWAWLWSSRFWAAHVGLDFIRLGYEWKVKKQKTTALTDSEKSAVAQADEEWKAKWRKEMVVNAAYAPLTIHWSLEKGLVSDLWVGIFGSIAGISGMRVLWKNTTKPL